jgi:hypothetical protein
MTFWRLHSVSINRWNLLRWAQQKELVSVPWHQQVKVKVNLRPTVSWPVCLGVRHPSGTHDQFFFLLEISFWQLRVCYFVASSLMRGRVYNLLYNCFWALPEQSLLGQSPVELRPYFTVSSETPQTWRARSPYLYSPGTGWRSYTPGTGFLFCRILRLAVLR